MLQSDRRYPSYRFKEIGDQHFFKRKWGHKYGVPSANVRQGPAERQPRNGGFSTSFSRTGSRPGSPSPILVTIWNTQRVNPDTRLINLKETYFGQSSLIQDQWLNSSKDWQQKPRSFARREAGASPTEFPQHCVHLVSPFAMFTLVPPIITEKFRSFSRGRSVTLMGVGEKGESTLFEKKGKKDPSIRSKTETHIGPMRNLQILSQNLFNHCMVDAPASLRTNDRGFSDNYLTSKLFVWQLKPNSSIFTVLNTSSDYNSFGS